MIATTVLLASGMSGLTEDSVAILKEPTGGYYVGFPFDHHLAEGESIAAYFKGLGYKLESTLAEKLKNLSSYELISCKIQGDTLVYFRPSFLYSIP